MAYGIINEPCLMLKPNIIVKFTPHVHTLWGCWSDLYTVSPYIDYVYTCLSKYVLQPSVLC